MAVPNIEEISHRARVLEAEEPEVPNNVDKGSWIVIYN